MSTIPTTPKFHQVASAHGHVLRADFKGCRLEMNLDKTWLQIINDDSDCESCIIDSDSNVISESGEIVTSHWTDPDWDILKQAVVNA